MCVVELSCTYDWCMRSGEVSIVPPANQEVSIHQVKQYISKNGVRCLKFEIYAKCENKCCFYSYLAQFKPV